jgi:pimeloyl-ACP methyl ester carboxylesterase
MIAARGGKRGPCWITRFVAVAILAHAGPALAGEAREAPAVAEAAAELRWTVPYQAGKVPVVFVHGFLGSHINWSVMIDELSTDPPVRARFQFLTFGYDSLESIPESGLKLQAALDEARRRLDPEGRDPSFDRVIVVGHSMGGLVAKAAARGRDPDSPGAAGPPPAGQGKPVTTRVGRIIFVATPHRGTGADHGAMRSAAIWFARNFNTTSPTPRTRKGARAWDVATSVDQLTWNHPLLADLQRAGAATGVPCHSIIATLQDPAAPEATDGLVPFASARLEGAQSELVVRTNHFCFQHRDVIREVRRVLVEHATQPGTGARAENQRTPGNPLNESSAR